MASIVTPLAASLLPLSLAWGALSMPVNGNGTWAEEEQTAPLRSRCQLRVDDDGESIVLEGVVFARRSASGSYQLRVSQQSAGGSSDIVQSGDFIVEFNSTASLVTVSLSNGVSRYVAELTVQWDDGTADCVAEAPKRRKVNLFEEKNTLPGEGPFASTPVQPHDQAAPK
jgi:curli production assembly/transport CsgH protein